MIRQDHTLPSTAISTAIPQYYASLPQKAPGQREAENFSEIEKFTENLKNSSIEAGLFQGRKIIYKNNGNDKNISHHTLQELHIHLIGLRHLLPTTQLSSQEKASCEALCVQLQKIIDTSTKPVQTDSTNRIISLWLQVRNRISNWLSGDSVWLQQIQKDLDAFKASTLVSAPADDMRPHAVGILCRLAHQKKWSLIKQTDLQFTFAKGEDALACAESVCKAFDAYLPDQGNDDLNKTPLPEGTWWIKTQSCFSLNDVLCRKILEKPDSPAVAS